MAPGLNAQTFIPNHKVICTLTNNHIAVGANPGLSLVITPTIGRLNGVVDTPAVLGAPISHPKQTDV
jgi:hypothetical protein